MDDKQRRRLRGEHIESYTQDAPIGANSKIPAILRGIKQWGPDLGALPGDLADALAYAGRKIMSGQSERPVPSLGAGAATRGALSKVAPRKQTEATEWKEPSLTEEAVRFMNPTLWGNPLKFFASPAGRLFGALGGDVSGALGVIKGRGGNWHPDFGPQSLISSELRAANLERILPEIERLGQQMDPQALDHAKTMDSWVKGPLLKYLMRDMATEGDPIRKLADQGILHVKPDELNFNMSMYGKWPREGQTFHAKSDAAKAWEGATDNQIENIPAWQLSPPESTPFSRANPWISKLPKDTPIHTLPESKNTMEDLGLDRLHQHVYEELLSGNIRPEQLKSGSFGVEAAVRHMADKRMKEEAAAEAAALKALVNRATVEHKAYPEGYKWVEFKAPKVSEPLQEAPPEVADQLQEDAYNWVLRHSRGLDDESEEFMMKVMDRYHQAEQDWLAGNGHGMDYDELKQALRAEGDYMGHCVGDYCDDVAEGTTRIFSLRDPKGKSMVTIEARKRAPGDDWTIQQIKGSGKKDSAQRITSEDIQLVQPYIQDFLNSGNYSKVRDLPNAQLRDMKDLYGEGLPQGSKRFMTDSEQQEFNKLYPDLESTLSKQLDEGDWIPEDEIEFANGGLVRAPEFYNNLEVFLRG